MSEVPSNWSIEAEQSVLGALLMDNRALASVEDSIAPTDFYESRHAEIYSAIRSLISSGRAADVVTVFDYLRDHGYNTIGIEYLHALSNCVPSANHISPYVALVVEKANQRRLAAAASTALQIAAGPGTAQEKLERVTAMFVAIERGQQRRAPVRIESLLATALDRYDALADGRGQKAMSTGIERLDEMLSGGLRPGRLYGIGARPSVGKSSAAREVLLNIAKADVPVLLLSLEMPADEVADGLVAQVGRIDGSRLQTGQLTNDDWTRLVEASETLRRVPLFIDDQGALTLAQIRAKARQIRHLRVLAVDYLQLCSATRRDRSTNDEIAEISRGLKALALEMNVAVVVLTQLNREVEKRIDKEPALSDLRDSGAIEQDLDVAILLWTVREEQDSRLVGWKVAKNRSGARGAFSMRWSPATNRWTASDEPLRREAASRAEGFR